jgi:hypothetical protein
MNNAARYVLQQSLTVVMAAAVAACAGDASIGPTSPQLTAAAVAPHDDAGAVHVAGAGRYRAVDLGTCTNLQAPAGAILIFHVYATGDQIYRWNGTSWVFVAPSAVLSADGGGHGIVGTHYAGPTWESNSRSKVVGTVLDRCTTSTSAIPWLSLTVVSSNGPGIFDGVTFIQRVNTVGGIAPATAGTFVGETVNVPYTAEYYFYR